MALAARGARNMDSDVEAVADPEEAAECRRRALVIAGQATLIAALMTLIASFGRAR